MKKNKGESGGMAYFHKDHWENKLSNLPCGSHKYGAFDAGKEQFESAKKLNSYVNSHSPKR